MTSNFLSRGAAVLGIGLAFAACDSTPTGPGGSEGPTRVILSSTSGSAVNALLTDASFSIAPGKGNAKGKNNGPISLEDLEKIEVEIVGISLAMTGTTDDASGEDGEDDGSWYDLPLDPETPTVIDLKNLGDLEIASVPLDVSGDIEAIRLYFGDALVTFLSGETEELFIPSGKVTIAADRISVNEGEDVVLSFLAGTSVKKIKRTGRGLLMPPAFNIANASGGDDADAEDDEADNDSEDDDSEEEDNSSNDGDDSGDGTTTTT